MTNSKKALLLLGTCLGVAALTCCCLKHSISPDPEIYILKSKARMPDKGDVVEYVDVPNSNIYLTNVDGKLVTTKDASFGAPEPGVDRPPVFNKSEGLDPRCFSTVDYSMDVEPLENIGLTEENTTITFINFDEDGRVESRELSDQNGTEFKTFKDTYLQGNMDYIGVQSQLVGIDRPDGNDVQTSIHVSKGYQYIPTEKTPFFQELDTSKMGEEGHVFFYVLLDRHLYFNRKFAAVIPYKPNVEASLGELFTPFFQYPIVPHTPTPEYPEVPTYDRLDVMTFHFKRGGDMMRGMEADGDEEVICSYPYDIGVISRGQKIDDSTPVRETPLLIDPDVRTKGIKR